MACWSICETCPREVEEIAFQDRLIPYISADRKKRGDEAKPGQILISPRVLMAVKEAVTVEAVGEFELKGIRRPIAAYNVLSAASPSP